jgi:pimeloyl-ACP methyl ester carboxylesterase
MSFMKVFARHLSVAVACVTMFAGLSAQEPAVDPGATSRFYVTFRGVRLGSEIVTVTRADGAFTISARGQLGPPIDLITNTFQMVYSNDWQPRTLKIEAALRNQTLVVSTTFGLTTAISDVVQGTQKGSASHDITPRAVVLPPSYIGAYEILAARLPGFRVGSSFPVYVAPDGEISGTLNRVTPRRIVMPGQTTDIKEFDITLMRAGAPTSVLIWVDDRNRLAKVVFGDQGYAAIREDISTVMAREEKVHNAGDSDSFIPAAGFSLAATITEPAKPETAKPDQAKMPAVVLVGSQGRQDRDETLYGVSIFGQLAGELAKAGYLTVRYDKRGIGQSGGRPEHAGIEEYSEDVRAIVTWLRKRKDVDANRVFVVSHGDGSAIAMTLAGMDKSVRGIALIGAPGLTGRETVLAQQQAVLARLGGSSADRDARLMMQRRIIDASITGKGWDSIPVDVRRQADTEWFRTWLLFDPAVAMKKVDQPFMVVQGSLDKETPVAWADRLEQLARTRKGSAGAATTKVIVPGVNHLLLPAKTGEPDEYDTLPTQTISPDAVKAITDWLNSIKRQ